MARGWAALAVSVLVGACAASPAAPQRPLAPSPVTIAVEGDPNGIFWDALEHRLLVADDDGNRILSWTDAAGFSVLRELSGAEQKAGLGQLVRLPDGTIVVARFGRGADGDVIVVPPGAAPHDVPGLDPARRRIGLAVAPDGVVYGAWFIKQGNESRIGAVSELSLEGGEREVITGLEKPIGVLATAESLFVSDQRRGQILIAPRTVPAHATVFASLPQPDLLAAGPEGSLFCGSATGGLYRVSAGGEVTRLGGSYRQVRGVAYDAEGRRLFVVDHDPDASDGIAHRLHILPVDTGAAAAR